MVFFCLFCGNGDRVTPSDENISGEALEKRESTAVVDVIDGVKHVHNTTSQWTEDPEVKLEFVRKFGQLYKPFDISLDSNRNVYVADSGNHRIQKYSPDGEFLVSNGRKGQGPGEFQIMGGVAVDNEGQMYITDRSTNRLKVLSPEGNEIKNIATMKITGEIALLSSGESVLTRGLFFSQESYPGLLQIVDEDGQILRTAGTQKLYEDWDCYRYFNRISFAVDDEDNLYLAYATRNKIEKYTPDGTLRMTIDRPLNYGISEKIEKIKRQVGPRQIELPELNFVSKSLAVDAKKRIWVLSFDRQLTFEELPVTIHFADAEGQLEATDTLKTSESPKTDAFVFHVFDKSGEFLGEIPLAHFADRVKIDGDRLYILEKDNEMCVYEYRIVNTI
ncbi:MAG: NHL repeat-containing protein [Candidatus Aminicenantes bacterium]|nr:MAG: NHL repeat-containing protein [Candidatus Aminicenantes bacterium]